MPATLQNDQISIAVKSLGAELSSIKDLKTNTEYLWQGDPAYWTGQSPLLFPIIGGLPNDQYELNGQIYKMNGHGFGKFSEFELIEQDSTNLTWQLTYNPTTLGQYPYHFSLQVRYAIEGRTIKTSYTVNNLDHKEMLFSIGAHPGFNCNPMEDYVLAFEKSETVKRRYKTGNLLDGRREQLLDNESELQLSHRLFDNGAVIIDNYKSHWVELTNKKTKQAIRVTFEGFPYLGFWSPKNEAPFVCIEPWYGVDSSEGDDPDFYKKEGLLKIQPQQSFTCDYSIIV